MPLIRSTYTMYQSLWLYSCKLRRSHEGNALKTVMILKLSWHLARLRSSLTCKPISYLLSAFYAFNMTTISFQFLTQVSICCQLCYRNCRSGCTWDPSALLNNYVWRNTINHLKLFLVLHIVLITDVNILCQLQLLVLFIFIFRKYVFIERTTLSQ